METLKTWEIDIKNCRGQSFDNANNMSGAYSLQARVKEHNRLALYVLCSTHSLNFWCTKIAAEYCSEARLFFMLFKKIYNFSASTHRWTVLCSKLKGCLVVKNLSFTRWAARVDACNSLHKNYKVIFETLTMIADDSSEKSITHIEAEGIIHHLERFETAFLTVMWSTLMERFYADCIPDCKLQIICLNKVIELYDSLSKFVSSVRDIFDYYESEAGKMLASDNEYDISKKRKRIRKLQADESREGDVELKGDI